MKKIETPLVCLPTDKASNLQFVHEDRKFYLSPYNSDDPTNTIDNLGVAHFLYGLSDETPKEGDWLIPECVNELFNNKPIRYVRKDDKMKNCIIVWDGEKEHLTTINLFNKAPKITSTNNPELWYDFDGFSGGGNPTINVAKMPLSLIEHYAKYQPKEVMLEYEETVSMPQEHLLTGSDIEIEARKNPTLKLKLTPSGEVCWSPVEKAKGIIWGAQEKTLKDQTEIVKQRLHYHFAQVGGGWLIPKDAPFMKEFLNEVKRLCDIAEKHSK